MDGLIYLLRLDYPNLDVSTLKPIVRRILEILVFDAENNNAICVQPASVDEPLTCFMLSDWLSLYLK